jgi:catechol 2,3-dioxygenase-like lactoylglutathione lyase family enzyme
MGEAWRLRHFYHTIVNARDIGESVRFYEMLGFVIVSDRRDAVWPDGSGASFALVPNPKGRGVLMILPSDPEGPMLDLIEWQVPRADFPEPAPTRIPRVLAFRTENVRAAHVALKAKGVRFTTEEPTSIPAAGITGCIVAYDPNGNLIEMIELEPGLRHSRIKEAFTPETKA